VVTCEIDLFGNIRILFHAVVTREINIPHCLSHYDSA